MGFRSTKLICRSYKIHPRLKPVADRIAYICGFYFYAVCRCGIPKHANRVDQMKKYLWIILLYLTMGVVVRAQRHEIGIFSGGSNLIGEVGVSNYIAPNNLIFGIKYRYKLNPGYSIRLNLMGAGIHASDRKASEEYRKNRALSVQNYIGEASILFELNFFDFNGTQKTQSTPFTFAGIGLIGYRDRIFVLNYHKRRNTNGMSIEPTSGTDFERIERSKNTTSLSHTIPFGIGYKHKFLYNWVISSEIGIRATGTTNIDHKTPEIQQTIEEDLKTDRYQTEIQRQTKSFIDEKTFGNTRSKNWYVFSGFSLTYIFGRPPCYYD